MRFFVLLLLAGCADYGDETTHFGDLLAHDALALDVTCDTNLTVVLGNRFHPGDHCLALADGVTATVGGKAAEVVPGQQQPREFLGSGNGITCPSVFFEGLDQLGRNIELVLEDAMGSFTTTLENPSHDPLAATPALMNDQFHVPSGGQLVIGVPTGETIRDNFFDVSIWTAGGDPVLDPDDNYDGKAASNGAQMVIPMRPPSGSSGYVEFQTLSTRAVENCPHAACSFTVKRGAQYDLFVD